MTNYSDPNNENSGETSPESTTDNKPAYSPYPEKSKKTWVWVLPLIILTLAIGLLAGRWWGKNDLKNQMADDEKSVIPQIASAVGITEVEKPVEEKPVLTVETVKAKSSQIVNDISADGTINPENTSTVSGKINGVAIENVMVKEGDWVNKGQVLATFDTDTLQQQLRQAQADVAEAETSYLLAKNNADRALPLLEIDAISEQEIDRLVATARQASAGVEAAKARLNSQQLNMNNSQVKAPVSGIISDKMANIGSVPGPEPLFTIIENGKLEWQAQVDPDKVGKINLGTLVEVSLPNNKSVKGKVSRISPTADKGSRQISIAASLQKHPNARAGMYQRGKFILGNDSKLTIPVSAVVVKDGYDYVMQVKAVKDEERNTIHRVSLIKVKLGERQGDRVVLLEPLKGNGLIVRQGGSFLNDGDMVRLASDTPAK